MKQRDHRVELLQSTIARAAEKLMDAESEVQEDWWRGLHAEVRQSLKFISEEMSSVEADAQQRPLAEERLALHKERKRLEALEAKLQEAN